MAATAVSLVAPAASPADGASWGSALRVGLFVYESAEPSALEAARVAVGQSVPVLAYDAAEREFFATELAERCAPGQFAVAGLTSSQGCDAAREWAASLGWPIHHSAPVGDEPLMHWIVAPYMPR